MEIEHRVSSLSHLFEARHELRKHLVLETALIEQICELPEDDFCHQAREAMALGAGYAYLQKDKEPGEDQWIHVFTAFFALQPRHRYEDPEVTRARQEEIIKAALDWYDSTEEPNIDPHINQYTVEGLAAFINGFVMTREYFATDAPVESDVA